MIFWSDKVSGWSQVQKQEPLFPFRKVPELDNNIEGLIIIFLSPYLLFLSIYFFSDLTSASKYIQDPLWIGADTDPSWVDLARMGYDREGTGNCCLWCSVPSFGHFLPMTSSYWSLLAQDKEWSKRLTIQYLLFEDPQHTFKMLFRYGSYLVNHLFLCYVIIHIVISNRSDPI